MTVGVEVQLYDASNIALASVSGIQIAWFDTPNVSDLSRVQATHTGVSTDASGWLRLDLGTVSGLPVGDWGFLVAYKLNATNHKASLIFASKMQVATIASGSSLVPIISVYRNPDWPAQIATVTGVQKITGLLAVYDQPHNYVAVSAAANYTVNWGDGGGNFNTATGVTAQRDIVYSSVSGTVVGASDAVAVTFTDTGDIVTRTAHGFQNGQPLNCASIVSTTGISINTTYFVVGRAVNTFQLAATRGGAALALTTNGSGTVYAPQYKVAIVTVTPQAANNLTSFTLQVNHSLLGVNRAVPWLDIAINGQFLTSLVLNGTLAPMNPTVSSMAYLVIGENAITSFASLCSGLSNLISVQAATQSGTNFSSMFNGCRSLRAVTLSNTSSGINSTSMFSGCYSLRAAPYMDTVANKNFSSMFFNCYRLTSIPLLNTAVGTAFSTMFGNCYALTSIPFLNTVLGTGFSSMFSGCYSLTSIPLLNTAAGTDFGSMFFNCYSMTTIPQLSTGAGTVFGSMFYGCSSLTSIPLLNTAAGTVFGSMFFGCYSMTTIPQLSTGAGTNFSSMFSGCYSLTSIPLLNTAAGTAFTTMFGNCGSLTSIPLLNTALGTDFGSMFLNCSNLSRVPLLNCAAITAVPTNMFSGCIVLQAGALLGMGQTISYQGGLMYAAALNDIYTNLPTVTAKTITVTGNPGSGAGDTPSIATAKGWTVTA